MSTAVASVGIDLDTQRLAWCGVDASDAVVDYGVIVRRKGTGSAPLVGSWGTELAWLCGWCAAREVRVSLEGVYFKPAKDGKPRCGVAGYLAHREVIEEVAGALRAAGVRVTVVGASTWQRSVLGKGLTRAEAKSRALGVIANERWRGGWERGNEHLADARCIARWGLGEVNAESAGCAEGRGGRGKRRRALA